MERDNDILKEDDMFISERHCKATDDTGKDIKEFSSSIEFVGLMDQTIEALIHSLSDHFSSWYQLQYNQYELCTDVKDEAKTCTYLGVKFVEDVFEIVPFY